MCTRCSFSAPGTRLALFMHCRPETKSKVCQKIAQSGFESEKEEDNFQPSNKRHTKPSPKIKQGTLLKLYRWKTISKRYMYVPKIPRTQSG